MVAKGFGVSIDSQFERNSLVWGSSGTYPAGGWVGGWVVGWLDKVKLRTTQLQLQLKLKFKLKLSLATSWG